MAMLVTVQLHHHQLILVGVHQHLAGAQLLVMLATDQINLNQHIHRAVLRVKVGVQLLVKHVVKIKF